MRVFVTGGAGFIGSHLVDSLLARGDAVVAYDDLSTGREQFLAHARQRAGFSLVRGDVLDAARLRAAMAGSELVCHLQASADVRGGPDDPRRDLSQNIVATFAVLEAARDVGATSVLFASSAVVYGEPTVFPTPEHVELIQTSTYGAAKLAGEGLLEAFSEYYGLRAFVFRFVSFIGERYTHGVVFDFVRKLRADPRRLAILGDGKQRKSYLYVADGVAGMLHALEHARARINVFNLGHDEVLSVCAVADIVCEELGLGGVTYELGSGARGWKGDAPFVLLDTTRMKALGWRPVTPIADGIRRTVRHLVSHPELLDRP